MKKIIAVLAAAAMALSMLSFGAFAQEDFALPEAPAETVAPADEIPFNEVEPSNEGYVEGVIVSPAYEDEISEYECGREFIFAPQDLLSTLEESAPSFATKEEAGLYIRSVMKSYAPTATIKFNISANQDTFRAVIREFMTGAMNVAEAHTGVANEGDYIVTNYKSMGYSAHFDGSTVTCNIEFDYRQTAEQNQAVAAEADKILASLELDGKCDHDKAEAIYTWVASNVVYDNTLTRYATYDALVEHCSVCQGYASTVYYLMLKAGIDCRYISGTGYTGFDESGKAVGGAHGWNIIKLGNHYYNADATWDSTYLSIGRPFAYFLRSNAEFTRLSNGSSFIPDHVRKDTFDAMFDQVYPMAAESYTPEVHDHIEKPGKENISEATCREPGNTGDVVCRVGGEILIPGDEIPQLEHVPAEEKDNFKEATCTEDGYTGDTVCEKCGEIIEEGEVVEALGHKPLEEKQNVKEATCTEAGYTGDTVCERCEEILEKGEEIPALGHEYENGRCVRCHRKEGNFEPGDVNGDGKLSSVDAVLILRKLAGFKDEGVIEEAFDFNQDGTVGSLDAVEVLRKIAGID